LRDPDLAKLVPATTVVYRAFNPELPYAVRDRIWNKITGGKGQRPKASADRQGAALRFAKSFLKAAIQRTFCPDVQVVWTPFAIRLAKKIIVRHGIDAIILNAPPFSCLKIAVALKKAFPKVQLTIDFRDEWLGYYLRDFDTAVSAHKRAYAERLERDAIVAADFVSAVTPAQSDSIRRRYPDQPAEKFLYVPNGYDRVAHKIAPHTPANDSKFVVTYLGTVYANPVYAPISNYLDALETLPEEVRSRIETRFIGRIALEADPRLHRAHDNIVRIGFLPKMTALAKLAETDLQLLVAADPTTHAGKLFDYLGSGKPILALSPINGEIARIVRETRTGWCVPSDDTDAIRDALLLAFETRHAPATRPDWDAIRAYEWPNVISRMLQLTGISSQNVERESSIAARALR
jgi:glycosyltransferase involved in cell wall biosynthesis